VLGFPSGDFFQEFTEEEKVKEFCKTTYGVDFPMFKRSHVTNGGKFGLRKYKANSFFASLIEETGSQPVWNFNKYLISKDGSVKYFNQDVEPDSQELVGEILAMISK
jgi:glutathione peroxidase